MSFMDSVKSRFGRKDDDWDDGFDEYEDDYEEEDDGYVDDGDEGSSDGYYEDDYDAEDEEYADEYDLGQRQPGSDRDNSVRLVTHDSRQSSYGVRPVGYSAPSAPSGEYSYGARRSESASSYAADTRETTSAESVYDEEPSDLSHVVVLSPTSYNDVEPVASTLKSNQAVVLALRETRPELAKRVLDFSFGVASALGCHVEKLDERVFLITHKPNGLNEGERQYLVNLGIIR